MSKFAYFDPYDPETAKKCVFTAPRKIDEKITDERAIELWNTVTRTVKDKNDNKAILKSVNTASMSLAAKIQEFWNDETHISNKFDYMTPKASDLYKAAKFSSSKWGRIMSGELPDVERGNVFAIAIALRLDTEQTEELMYSAGFAINYELDLDAAMMYFIKKEEYNLDTIYEILGCFSNITNGLDCFIFQPRTAKQFPV